jgi:hypothetical protein
MILLEGRHVWENLMTSFVQIDDFLLFFKKREFNGYLHFQFADCNCALFLQDGDVVNGLEEWQEERRGGQKAVQSIIERSRQDKNGTIIIS